MQAQTTSDAPVVYFVQSDQGGPVKIGVSTTHSLAARIAALQTGSPYPLRVIHTIPGDRNVEAQMHLRFAASRVSGEWFLPSPEIAKFVGGKLRNRAEAEAQRRTMQRSYDRGYRDGYEAGKKDGQDEMLGLVSSLLRPVVNLVSAVDDVPALQEVA